MMRWLVKLFLVAILLSPVVLLGVAWMCFQESPLVVRKAELGPEQIERGKRIVEAHDPRKAKAGVLRSVTLLQEDADLALNYLALRSAAGAADVRFLDGLAMVRAALDTGGNPLGRWLNVEAVLRDTGALPEFDSLRLGSVPVPGALANWLLARVVEHATASEDARLAADVIRSVKFGAGSVRVEYAWQEGLPERLRALALPEAERVRLREWHEQLHAAAGAAGGGGRVSLERLLVPMLAQAATRSGDAVADNRALILVLAFYVNGRGMEALLPEARDWPRPPPRPVTLGGRDDFAKHFTISAALAATAGSPLSDAVGLYKEVADSRGGSGFSFNDIAADRAGTRFGEAAAASAQSARALQVRAQAGFGEEAFMPRTDGLPEFMPEAEFKRRYGGVGAPEYQRMMGEIERRVAALSLYR